MDRNILFTGRFLAAPKQALRPGAWYIGFRCADCGEHFAIMDEPTDSGEITLSGNATFDAVCPNCARARSYAAAELVVFEAAQGGPASTA